MPKPVDQLQLNESLPRDRATPQKLRPLRGPDDFIGVRRQALGRFPLSSNGFFAYDGISFVSRVRAHASQSKQLMNNSLA